MKEFFNKMMKYFFTLHQINITISKVPEENAPIPEISLEQKVGNAVEVIKDLYESLKGYD